MNRPEDVILIFLKAPQLGQVKTRLARAVGDRRALAIYRSLVERQCGDLPEDSRIEIHFAPTDAEASMRDWLGTKFHYYPQTDGDLGQRLQHGIAEAFGRGASTVTSIGGDCPDLCARHIKEAQIQIHAGHDVVIGPSEDGGYYLISLAAPHRTLFEAIPWSAANTLAVSKEKAAQLGLKLSLLETLYDVDQHEDMDRAIRDGRIR